MQTKPTVWTAKRLLPLAAGFTLLCAASVIFIGNGRSFVPKPTMPNQASTSVPTVSGTQTEGAAPETTAESIDAAPPLGGFKAVPDRDPKGIHSMNLDGIFGYFGVRFDISEVLPDMTFYDGGLYSFPVRSPAYRFGRYEEEQAQDPSKGYDLNFFSYRNSEKTRSVSILVGRQSSFGRIRDAVLPPGQRVLWPEALNHPYRTAEINGTKIDLTHYTAEYPALGGAAYDKEIGSHYADFSYKGLNFCVETENVREEDFLLVLGYLSAL